MRSLIDRRVIFVAIGWLALSIGAIAAPLLLVLAWPGTALALFLAGIGSTADLRAAIRLGDPVSLAADAQRRLSVLLVTLTCAAVVGAVGAMVPSMASRSANGVVVGEYALSILIAPTLWTAIAILAVRAFQLPSPRRLAIVAIMTIASWPFLLAIRALRVPVFDLDDEFVLLAPWAINLYVGAIVMASAAAILLAFLAERITSAQAGQFLPRASATTWPMRS